MTTRSSSPLPPQAELAELGDGGPLGAGAAVLAHERFAHTAALDPARQALIFGGETVSYGELDRRSVSIASDLLDAGLARGDVVGLFLPRGTAAIASILAIMRAGGVYLPLDPTHPSERREYVVRDARARFVIAEKESAGDLAAGGVRVVRPREASADPPAVQAQGVGARDLAYLLYTSGSTGDPKGVEVEHRSLAALVEWATSAFSAHELSRVLLSTSLGFDISLFEVFAPFASGGTIVLAESLFDTQAYSDRNVTLVNTVPSLMAAYLRDHELPRTVRTVVLAGEPLSQDLVERVHRHEGIERVVNAYGPTEDTIYSTAGEVVPGRRPSIGRPVSGTKVYLVDDHGGLVPRGEPGEIWLAGTGLARGYRGKRELTEARFADVSLPGAPGRRVYRTGDLGRWEEDGTLAHLGRIDRQVKIRGVRIEPAEIEAVLLRHPDVEQASVVPTALASGETGLVGYAVCAGRPQGAARDLREFMRGQLPATMVPAQVLVIEEMPLSPNGKLDTARLPAAVSSRPRRAPRSDTEERLASVWAELLDLDLLPDGDDDFFDLGGHSLLAFKLLDGLARDFGADLSPQVLVEASTLSALARRVDDGGRDGRRLVALNNSGERTPCVYLHAGAGGTFTLRALSDALGPDQPLYGIQAYFGRRRSNGRLLDVKTTARECMSVLRSAQPSGPYILAGHSAGGHVAYEMACLLADEGELVSLLVLIDPPAPHTLRAPGRLVARGLELLGLGPEGRRAGYGRALLAEIQRVMRASSRQVHAPLPAADSAAGEDHEWLLSLRELERAYAPRRFTGRVVLFQTEESTRRTGTASLGWRRYARRLETVRVPGGHVSMLSDPYVAILGQELALRLRDVPGPV